MFPVFLWHSLRSIHTQRRCKTARAPFAISPASLTIVDVSVALLNAVYTALGEGLIGSGPRTTPKDSSRLGGWTQHVVLLSRHQGPRSRDSHLFSSQCFRSRRLIFLLLVEQQVQLRHRDASGTLPCKAHAQDGTRRWRVFQHPPPQALQRWAFRTWITFLSALGHTAFRSLAALGCCRRRESALERLVTMEIIRNQNIKAEHKLITSDCVPPSLPPNVCMIGNTATELITCSTTTS